jgi:rhodanese-related sulfurtransferase
MKSITAAELKDRIAAGETLVIIDVREPWEHEEFNIGGRNIPLHSIEGRLSELEPYKAVELIVHCKSGSRGMTAQRVLERHGFVAVRHLEDGLSHW